MAIFDSFKKKDNSIEVIPDNLSLLDSPRNLWSLASSFATDFFIVKFFAVWCSPCSRMMKTLSLVRTSSKVFLVKVDIDKFPSTTKSQLFSVKTIPTLFIFKNGKLLTKIESSLISKNELEAILTI